MLRTAIGTTNVTPIEVVTDRAPTYPVVLEGLLPATWHRTERYGNNRVEADHGRLGAGVFECRNVSLWPRGAPPDVVHLEGAF